MDTQKYLIQHVTQALERSWSAETIYPELDWSPDNPARGQCVVSALVVHDYFGGDFIRFEVETGSVKEKHYINLLENGERLDITGKQYGGEVVMVESPINLYEYKSIRDKLLDDEDTRNRYELLSRRVSDYLARENQTSESGGNLQ